MPSKKLYTREKYLPCRKAKLVGKYYTTEVTTKFYQNELSLLLPHVHFPTKFDFMFNETEDQINRISIPSDSSLHNIEILKVKHNYIIMTIWYIWTEDTQHMSILIADTTKKRIEWFDTYNTYKYIYEPLKKKIQAYFPNYHIVKVHQRNIQEDDNDHYCQTWPYYYMYKRLYKKQSMKKIMGHIMKKSKSRRTDIIRKFHYTINDLRKRRL